MFPESHRKFPLDIRCPHSKYVSMLLSPYHPPSPFDVVSWTPDQFCSGSQSPVPVAAALLSLGHRHIHGDLKAKAGFPSCPKFSVFAVGSSKGSGDWRCPIPSPARIYSGGGWGAFSNIPEVTGSRGGKKPFW